MSDRIVYLVDKVTPALNKAGLEVVDDAGLAEIMAEGLEVISTTPRKIGGRHEATMFILRPAKENRGLATTGGQRSGSEHVVAMGEDPSGGGASLPAVMRQLTHAISTAHHPLGPTEEGFAGFRPVSGKIVTQAFDVGLHAGMQGLPATSCPFPPGSAAYQKWIEGYRAASRKSAPPGEDEIKAARAHARRMVNQLAEEDEVSCPYPSGSPLRAIWIEAFKEAGGRVE